MAGRFEGKQALILGVANKRSIAWAIAKRLHDEGAELAFTFQGERIEKGVRELAESVDAKLVTECDVRSDDDVARVFAETGEAFGGGRLHPGAVPARRRVSAPGRRLVPLRHPARAQPDAPDREGSRARLRGREVR